MDVSKLIQASRLSYSIVAVAFIITLCTAIVRQSGSWSGVIVLLLFLAALCPAVLAIMSPARDEDDWWSPIWSPPPVVGLYILTIVILTATFLRRNALADVEIVLSAAAAASLTGSLFGFVFAIPRSLEHPNASDAAEDQFYAPNTNLEQISDWLTKILVGISLVEFRDMIAEFDQAVYWMASALGDAKQLFFPGTILLGYAIAGFFCAYVWTRLRFSRDLTSLERHARDSGEYLEGLANAYLYQPAPQGYTRSLKLAQRYLDKFGHDNDRVWLYLACGNGQKYRDLKLQYDDTPTQDQVKELEVLATEALKALERVRARVPSQYHIAVGLWDKHQSTDDGDDLQAFFRHPDFVEFFKSWKAELTDPQQPPSQ